MGFRALITGMSKRPVGSSRASARRRQVASELALRLRFGDPDAAFRLKQRQRALRGIALSGWHWRLELANEARGRNRSVPATDEDPRD
jgi:hypothetical protein